MFYYWNINRRKERKKRDNYLNKIRTANCIKCDWLNATYVVIFVLAYFEDSSSIVLWLELHDLIKRVNEEVCLFSRYVSGITKTFTHFFF